MLLLFIMVEINDVKLDILDIYEGVSYVDNHSGKLL